MGKTEKIITIENLRVFKKQIEKEIADAVAGKFGYNLYCGVAGFSYVKDETESGQCGTAVYREDGE